MKAYPITSKPSLIALAAGGALLLLALWCARHPAVSVEAAAARRAQLTVEVNTNGKIEPVPEAEVRVHARLEGRIIAIPEPGTRVETGDVMLQIDDRPVASKLAEAEYLLGVAYYRMGAQSKAVEVLQGYVEAYPDGAFAGDAVALLRLISVLQFPCGCTLQLHEAIIRPLHYH